MANLDKPWYESCMVDLEGFALKDALLYFEVEQPKKPRDVKNTDKVPKPYLQDLNEPNGMQMALETICRKMVVPVTSSNKLEIVLAHAASIIATMKNMFSHMTREIQKRQPEKEMEKAKSVRAAVWDLHQFVKEFWHDNKNVDIIKKWRELDLVEHERRVTVLMKEINKCQMKCGYEVTQYCIEYIWHSIDFPIGSIAAIFAGQHGNPTHDQYRSTLNQTQVWYLQHQKEILELPPRQGLIVYEALIQNPDLRSWIPKLNWITLNEDAVKLILEGLVELVIPLSICTQIGTYTALWATIKQSFERVVDYLIFCEQTDLPDCTDMRPEILANVMELKCYFEYTVFVSSTFVKRIWKFSANEPKVKRIKAILEKINKCQKACKFDVTSPKKDWGIKLEEQFVPEEVILDEVDDYSVAVDLNKTIVSEKKDKAQKKELPANNMALDDEEEKFGKVEKVHDDEMGETNDGGVHLEQESIDVEIIADDDADVFDPNKKIKLEKEGEAENKEVTANDMALDDDEEKSGKVEKVHGDEMGETNDGGVHLEQEPIHVEIISDDDADVFDPNKKIKLEKEGEAENKAVTANDMALDGDDQESNDESSQSLYTQDNV